MKEVIVECVIQAKPNRLHMVAELTRARITVAVVFTTAAGYLLKAGRIDAFIVLPVLGVFLLAAGATILNQLQEFRTDSLMERTRTRPLQSGAISKSTAWFVAVLLILLGLVVLTSNTGQPYLLLMLGLAAIVWYNGIYTPLKRLTAFAIVPGAVIGAMPPLIGYVSAGGRPTDPIIVLVGSFLFIWQIPHFWILILLLGEQYRQAGLPVLTDLFSRTQLRRITFTWITGAAVSGLIFPAVARDFLSWPWSLCIVGAAGYLIMKSTVFLRGPAREPVRSELRRAFMRINIFMMSVLACLVLSRLSTGIL